MVKEEVDAGNKVFFDITGGEGLILVAFGMLAQEFSLPIHLYDVVSDTLLEMNPQDADAISTYGDDLQKEKVKLDLATFIRMQGAVISAKKVQGEFDTSAYGFKQKIEALWDVLCDYKDKWNFYADVLGNNFMLNEIDVLCIEGNVPTFISCKGGRMDDGQALEPMYELLTVANRFGEKYAKKVLAIIHPLKQVYLDRAQEMGIEVRCYGK